MKTFLIEDPDEIQVVIDDDQVQLRVEKTSSRHLTVDVRKAMFNQMLTESGWQPSDGAFPGYWAHKAPGSRCLWSVFWQTVDGLVRPGDIFPDWLTSIDRFQFIDDEWVRVQYDGTPPQLFELADVAARGGDITQDIEILRADYKVFTWSFGSRPEKQPYVFRSDWPKPAWYLG